MRNYKPAVFQPTVRPDWGGALSYIPDKEKAEILVALFKYPSVECNSKFWLETIKPDLDFQYAEFTRLCELKSRGIRDRWGKTSCTGLVEVYKTCSTGVIVPEREREEEEESEGEKESIVVSKKSVKKTYGEMQKVKLTDEEYEKLKAIYNDKLDFAIDKLDSYLAQKRKDPYNSHYAVMKRNGWVYNEAFPADDIPSGPKILDPKNFVRAQPFGEEFNA